MPDPLVTVLTIDTVFHGRYRIVRCINAGSMGAVYEVLDTTTDSRRALKVMLPSIVEDADLRSRFEREARVTGAIESDHIVRVSDAGIDAVTGTPFLVMDLLRGEELGSLAKKRGALPPSDVVLYLTQVSLALDKTHAAGIVHRDLKPENMFITQRDDGSPCLKILDFGIAKVVVESKQAAQAAQATRPMGTPLYMAPEQIRGDALITPAADVYALGHIAYTLLVGEPYWYEEAQSVGVYGMIAKVLTGMPESATARAKRRRGVVLPPSFDAWIASASAMLAPERFASASVAAKALRTTLFAEQRISFVDIPAAPPAAMGTAAAGGTIPLSASSPSWQAPPFPPAMSGSGSHSQPRVSEPPLGPAAESAGAAMGMGRTGDVSLRDTAAARSSRSGLVIAVAAVAAMVVVLVAVFAVRSTSSASSAQPDAPSSTPKSDAVERSSSQPPPSPSTPAPLATPMRSGDGAPSTSADVEPSPLASASPSAASSPVPSAVASAQPSAKASASAKPILKPRKKYEGVL